MTHLLALYTNSSQGTLKVVVREGRAISTMALCYHSDRPGATIRRGVFQRQIAATDAEIDRLVYELYGLSEDEIAIVEESTP